MQYYHIGTAYFSLSLTRIPVKMFVRKIDTLRCYKCQWSLSSNKILWRRWAFTVEYTYVLQKNLYEANTICPNLSKTKIV